MIQVETVANETPGSLKTRLWQHGILYTIVYAMGGQTFSDERPHFRLAYRLRPQHMYEAV